MILADCGMPIFFIEALLDLTQKRNILYNFFLIHR